MTPIYSSKPHSGAIWEIKSKTKQKSQKPIWWKYDKRVPGEDVKVELRGIFLNISMKKYPIMLVYSL